MRRFPFLIFVAALLACAAPTRPVHAAQAPAVTVYVHGHHGNARSMQPLMQAAVQHEHATLALVASVASDGRVSWQGHLSPATARPLVQVIFQNARTVDDRRLRGYLHNVMLGLAQRGVRRVNFVAHSLGNTAVEWYLLRWGRAPQLPRVDKWAAIAGPFDSIPRMHMQPRRNHLEPDGRPHLLAPGFRQAYLQRARLPRVAILNLYGDLLDGSHSDGRILNASIRALGFLVRGYAASYHEARFTGASASHRALRNNSRVAAAVNRFLWPR